MKDITAEFESLGVPFRWVETEAPTRVCTTILDREKGEITELVENGRPLLAEELAEYRRVFIELAPRADAVVLIGSLPIGTPESFYRDLLGQTSCPVVVDFRGAGLISILDLEPDVVKPNREELSRTVNRPLDNDRELLAAMRWLNERGARWVVITQGSGSVWVSSAHQAYRLQPPLIQQVINPIASGDAMAATIAWGLRDGRAPIDCVRLGVAAAAQNVRQLLPCRLDPTTLESEAMSIDVERVE